MTGSIEGPPGPYKIFFFHLLTRRFSIYSIFIAFIFCVSLYIRAVLPHDAIFRGDHIVFAADDAVFHMRMVENLIGNFPHRIWFEAFTLYPHGDMLHFGPLWTYMIAITSLILGGGNPTLELTRTVGAYFPALFGALTVVPVYFIGREVFDRRAGLLSAFIIAVMPGQFLSRSVIGFTDHHAGEVFFSSLFLMLLVMAVKSIKGIDISFNDIRHRHWKKIQRPAVISLLAGVAFGLYMLQWSSGVFFGGIVAIFIVLQLIIYHMRGRPVEGLVMVGVIFYLAAFPPVLVFVDPRNSFSSGHYSYLHVLITAGSALFFLMLGWLSVRMKGMHRIYYPLTIAGIYAAGLGVASLFIPQIFSSFRDFFIIFRPRTGGGLTIREAVPPTHGMIYGSAGYPENFGNYPGIIDALSTFNLALATMLVLGVMFFLRRWGPERLLFIIWCITMYLMTTGQNRWFYYYSVNVAVLCGIFGIWLIDVAGWENISGRFDRVSSRNELYEFMYSNRRRHFLAVLAVVSVVMIVFLPNFNIASRSTFGGVASRGYYQWYESLNWMRFNTPETGLDFDAIYERPAQGGSFDYPESAYGVMSWWDYGHVITYFAHRIPNANPFQAGIGGGLDHAPGASTFFTAQSEEAADDVLWSLGVNGKPGSRYIISDAFMAYSIVHVMGIWNYEDVGDYKTRAVIADREMPVNTPHWYTTMEGRLHIFDGDGLKHYRMVHESVPNPYADGGNMEQSSKRTYNMFYGGNMSIENTGYVKIFEFVRGAAITGIAPGAENVTISNTIMTNQGRSFTYTRTTTPEDGVYSFEVPYSTLGPVPGGTNFDTGPAGPYIITAGSISKSVDVGEYEVQSGGTIVVDML